MGAYGRTARVRNLLETRSRRHIAPRLPCRDYRHRSWPLLLFARLPLARLPLALLQLARLLLALLPLATLQQEQRSMHPRMHRRMLGQRRVQMA